MSIRVIPLGAGQDVGKSCVLVQIGGKHIMFDCGMHMGYNDERRFPDFSYITRSGPVTQLIDAVIISHFHLDHCGALPYLTEMVGYSGPLYMTQPTKAIAPILLEDYRKITVEKKGETNFFTSQMIKDCMRKVTTIELHETIQVDDELEIKAYYAGHVLGAIMIHIKVGPYSVVYTGDYNMTADRHLGAAWIDACSPDVLITESTYATTIRDSKRCRERNFLNKVRECVDRGGRVLIPVFALGRAQELCILLETYWERNNMKVPIYFSTGLTEKATQYYKMFISWTSQKIKNTFVERNMFEFKHIQSFDKSYLEQSGPMVVFATPGMLHAGLSLQIFKRWAPDPNNMVIMPGYCVAGTVGAKILSGKKTIEIEKGVTINVKLAVEYLSFSAHADAKGIMQLIRQSNAKNVVLVHGEKQKMGFLKQKIEKEFHIECFHPANGHTVEILPSSHLPIDISSSLLNRSSELITLREGKRMGRDAMLDRVREGPVVEGAFLLDVTGKMKLIEDSEVYDVIGETEHELVFTTQFDFTEYNQGRHIPASTALSRIEELARKWIGSHCVLENQMLKVGSLSFSFLDANTATLTWSWKDEELSSALEVLIHSNQATIWRSLEGSAPHGPSSFSSSI